jgi:integrase
MASRIHAYPQKGGWLAAWPDASGQRRRKAGFATEDEALAYAVDAARGIGVGVEATPSHRPATVDELLDLFLDKKGATISSLTKKKMTRELRRAREAFGDRHPDSLNRLEIEDWRAALAAGSRHNAFRSFRQALTWAHQRGLTEREPSAGIRNPKRKRHERKPIIPFETWAEVDAIAYELGERYRAIPVFAVGTGLRPEEWIALERSDIDREARLIRVCKRYTDGRIEQGTKTVPERFVPLRARVLAAVDAMPTRIDTPILFPAPRGGYLEINRFRLQHWYPALRAAGLEQRGIYTARHTFATWAIESDVKLSYLAQMMGTSIREIEDTYFRWLQRTDEQLLAALDAYDAAISQ